MVPCYFSESTQSHNEVVFPLDVSQKVSSSVTSHRALILQHGKGCNLPKVECECFRLLTLSMLMNPRFTWENFHFERLSFTSLNIVLRMEVKGIVRR